MNELRKAVYKKSQETSEFKTLIGGRFFWDKYPPKDSSTEPTYPYVICHEIVDDYSFTFHEHFQELRVQFSIYSNSNSAKEVNTIYSSLISLFDWCSLTMDSYNHLKMQRVSKENFWDDKKDEYIITVDYIIQLQKA